MSVHDKVKDSDVMVVAAKFCGDIVGPTDNNIRSYLRKIVHIIYHQGVLN